MNIIEISGSIIIDNGKSITNGFLESIDLIIEKGDFVTFVGNENSGAHKIMKVIGGQEKVKRGDAFLFGNHITHSNKLHLANLIKDKIKYINYKGDLENLMEELKSSKPLIIIENLDLEKNQYDTIIQILKKKRSMGATVVASTKKEDFALRFYRRIYINNGKIQKEIRMLKTENLTLKENIEANI